MNRLIFVSYGIFFVGAFSAFSRLAVSSLLWAAKRAAARKADKVVALTAELGKAQTQQRHTESMRCVGRRGR